MILPMSFSYIIFIVLRYIPSISSLLSIFIMKECWTFQCVFWLCGDHSMVSVLQYADVVYRSDQFAYVERPYIPGINFAWSWWITFLMCCFIQFSSILWGFFHLCLSGILECSFLFFLLSLCGVGIRIILTLYNEFGRIPFYFNFLEYFDKNWY